MPRRGLYGVTLEELAPFKRDACELYPPQAVGLLSITSVVKVHVALVPAFHLTPERGRVLTRRRGGCSLVGVVVRWRWGSYPTGDPSPWSITEYRILPLKGDCKHFLMLFVKTFHGSPKPLKFQRF